VQVVITSKGADKILATNVKKDLVGPIFKAFFTKVSLVLLRITMAKAPVFTGNLRRSHVWHIDPSDPPMWGRVSVDAFYAPYVHEGTAPHFPPVQAIAKWAIAHGMNPWALAVSISKKGTRANRWLDRSVPEATTEAMALWEASATEIEKAWRN
jgi:hypothetical protein